MMAEKHPDEIALLSYVEDELAADHRQEVVEHLVSCPSCSQHVRRLEAGRDALRAAPLLELPEERRRELLSGLPERPDRWRLFRPVRRALVVAAPVAGAAVLVGVFVLAGTQLRGGGGDDDSEGAGAGGEAAETMTDSQRANEAAPEESSADADQRTSLLFKDAVLVRRVQGPPAEILDLLGHEGITAEIVEGAVIARAARADVRAALAERPAGGVDVYVR
jgi:hypothetical protein